MSRFPALLAVALSGLIGCADSTGPASPTPTPPGTAACAFTVALTESTFNAAGGTGLATVDTAPTCRWSMTAGGSPWLTVDRTTFTGPGVVALAVDPNRSLTARTSLLEIRRDSGAAAATQTVSQRAASCLYTITPDQTLLPWLGTSDGSDTGAFEAHIRAEPSNCQWTATSTVPWMELPRYSQKSGTGDGRISVSVFWNGNPATRAGLIVIAGLSGVNPDAQLLVMQSGRLIF